MNNSTIKSIYRQLLQFDDEIEFNKTKSDQVKKDLANNLDYIKWVDANFVDLCLPSGTLWCKYNLGATCGNTKESWYGDYYAWGELKQKKIYKEKNYIYMDNPSILPLSNDAVYQIYSKQIFNQKIPSMPTHEQMIELVENVDTKWITNYNGINCLNGKIFTSKINGNSLFMPSAGYCGGSELFCVCKECYLWTSSLHPRYQNYAQNLFFDSDDITANNANLRYCGLSVRGVL